MGIYLRRRNEKSRNVIITDNGLAYVVIPETVGQYTGLKDNNGTKIFEGDIIYFTVFDSTGGDTQYLGTVKYIKEFTDFDIEVENKEIKIFNLSWVLSQDDEFEIIGNIHDNPELLKGEK